MMKDILKWILIFGVLTPITVVGTLLAAKFGVHLEQYIGEVLSNIAVLLVSFGCGYGLKILSDLDKS